MLAWLLCFALGEEAAAQDAERAPGFSLTLLAPADAACPDPQALVRAVEMRVGRRAVSTTEPPELAIAVLIERTDAGHRALVSVRDGSGSEVGARELLAQGSCAALQEMLTLVVSASIGVARPAPPSAAIRAQNERALQPTEGSEPPQLPAIVHETGPARPWTLDVAGSLRVESGIAARPILGPSLSLWVTLGVLRLGVSGTWLAPVGDTLRLTGAYAELNLCGIVAQSERAGVNVCLAPRAGALHAQLLGLARAEAHGGALVQLSASAQAHWLFAPPLGVTCALGAALPVLYPRYQHVDERGLSRIDHTPELGVWIGLGLFVQLRTPRMSRAQVRPNGAILSRKPGDSW